MNDRSSSHPQVSWTWADMFLTYRFWGLLLVYLLALASAALISAWLPMHLRESSPSSATSWAGFVNLTVLMSGLLGFYVAWLATRYQAKNALLVAAALVVLGGLLLTWEFTTGIGLCLVGAVLFGIGTGTITLGVPAILAGGRGGAQAFVVAFGLLVTVTRVVEAPLVTLVGSLWDHYGSGVLAATVAILGILGVIALLPVSRELFTGPPKARTYDWVVKPRSPVLVGLGSVIGLIYYYFLFKFHGEVASLRPSSRILSPWGAVLLLFLPTTFAALVGGILRATAGTGELAVLLVFYLVLIMPVIILLSVITTTLVEPLNELAAERGRQPLIAPWVVFVFSVLFMPVAMALIQRALNQSIAMAAQDAA